MNEPFDEGPSSSSAAHEQPLGRYHPAFPSHDETLQRPASIYSDHLPMRYKVYLKNGKTLEFLTYNVLGRVDNSSGIHLKAETEEEFIARYTRIADFLKKASEGLDIICLQESSHPMEELLQKQLGDDWVVLPSKEHSLITAYRKSSLTLKTEEDEKKIGQTHITSYIHNATGEEIKLANIWGDYNHSPHFHEEYCRNFFNNPETTCIATGDFNVPVNPLTKELMYTGTGLIPPAYIKLRAPEIYEKNPKNQLEYPGDGAFLRDKKRKTHQLVGIMLDPETGNIFDQTYVENDEFSENYFKNFRMSMLLDDNARKQVLPISKLTLEAFEEHLKYSLQDNSILVRLGSNGRNERALCFRFQNKSPFAKALFEHMENLPGCKLHQEADDIDQKSYQYFDIPLKYIEKLENTLQDLLTSKWDFLAVIDKETKRLSKKSDRLFNKSKPTSKVERLSALQDVIEKQPHFSSAAAIAKARDGWFQEETKDKDGVTKTNKDILDDQRGRVHKDESKTMKHLKRFGANP